jgi:hypothetical protein
VVRRYQADFPRLIAAALAAMIGEHETKMIAEPLGERRGSGVLEWIREARIDQDGC